MKQEMMGWQWPKLDHMQVLSHFWTATKCLYTWTFLWSST